MVEGVEPSSNSCGRKVGFVHSHCSTTTERRTAAPGRFRRAAAFCGFIAVGALAALVMLAPSGPDPLPQAGSGHAPKNTVYNQPVVKDMNTGSTATPPTPNEAPVTTMAVPAIRGR
jgi:hypothetical protein